MTIATIEIESAKPFLKWAGGKRNLIEQYHLPSDFNNYWEPFVGGGALFFHLQPKSAYLSDINPELINTYKMVRDRVEDLLSLLATHQENHCPDYYLFVRSLSPSDPLEIAARLIYLNKTCFNGLYRLNGKGKFNVPMGTNKNCCEVEVLRAASKALRGCHLAVDSFENSLTRPQAGDFVFLDPPYVPLSATSSFASYYDKFGKEQHVKLAEMATQLSERGVKVAIANSWCDFTLALYPGFNVREVLASRNINSKGSKRGKIPELFATNY